jgi:hypothetical protein
VQNIDPGVHNAGTALIAVYRYLLGDFSPYLYRTDDFGKSWTKLTNGRNGIAADEPTRVVREDPERPGLLYAGTEFGLYVSFDDGANWQSFQQNLPAVPVTDLRLAHGDLVLSTQGRGFWVLDNLGVLRQATGSGSPTSDRLYKPATAIRINASGDKGSNPAEGPEYVLPGAQIDYFIAAPAKATPVTLTILDAAGQTVRTFSSDGPAARAGGGGGDDEGGNRYRPSYPSKLAATPGMHRFIWDLRYAGDPPPATATGGGRALPGPVAPPGTYTVVMTAGGQTMQQPLKLIEDPRVLASGVTVADLQEQFAHNMRVLALVRDTNAAVARIRKAEADLKVNPDPTRAKALAPISARLITPPIRYSAPGLQTHVTYLYRETADADQKVGRDAVDRYAELRKQIDAAVGDLDRVLGPADTAAPVPPRQPS